MKTDLGNLVAISPVQDLPYGVLANVQIGLHLKL
jgi:hypothetical protein